MTSEALGELGEAELKRMAAQGGFVANAATRDILGFDYVVEIQATDGPSAPAPDLEAPSHRAFVQVKATQQRRRSIGIKLSNWQRMVTDPSPWFVLVFEIADEGEVDAIYLVHIDEPWITDALFALRSASQAFNTTRKRIRYRDCDRLSKLHGAELRARVLSAIGRDPWEYQRAKRQTIESCGYGEFPHVAEITLPSQPRTEFIEEWTNIALGHETPVRFDELKLFDNRFGIKRMVTSARDGTITWSPNPRRGTLVIEVRDRADWISAPVAIYSTAVLPGFPANEARVRISLGPLSVVIPMMPSSNDGQPAVRASVSWAPDTPHSVSVIALAAKVARLMQQHGASMTLTTDDPSRRLEMTVIDLVLGDIAEMLELEHAGVVAARVNLEHVEVSSAEIIDQRPRFSALHFFSRKEFADLRMAFPAPEFEVTGECAMINVIGASFGAWGLVMCFAAIAHPVTESGMLVFKEGRIRLGGLWPVRVAKASDFPLSDKIEALCLELKRDEAIDTVFRPSNTRLGSDEQLSE